MFIHFEIRDPEIIWEQDFGEVGEGLGGCFVGKWTDSVSRNTFSAIFNYIQWYIHCSLVLGFLFEGGHWRRVFS